jgi:hypothetical protein
MEVTDSMLYSDLKTMIEEENDNVHYSWKLELFNGTELVDVEKVLGVSIDRDYPLNFNDVVMVEIVITQPKYQYKVLPYKDNLRVVLSKIPRNPDKSETTPDIANVVREYNCKLTDPQSNALMAGGGNAATEADDNLSMMMETTLQLIPTTIDEYKFREINVIMRDVTVEEAIKLLLMTNVAPEGGSELPVNSTAFEQGGFEGIAGVDMVPATNEHRYSHIIIPPGVRLLDVPNYLQKHYGVYDTGIGHYLQNGTWYVYPLYDITRYQDTDRTLTVVNIPQNMMPGIDNTFALDGVSLGVLATRDVVHLDSSDSDQVNHGNGYRLLPSKHVMDVFSITDGNVTTTSRRTNVIEQMVEGRVTGKNNAPFCNEHISDNTFRENSGLSARVGSSVVLVWENSDPDLVTPGMPVKFLYLKESKVTSLEGVVLKQSSHSAMLNPGFANEQYSTTTVLELFLSRE